jgi:VWFA-related protein
MDSSVICKCSLLTSRFILGALLLLPSVRAGLAQNSPSSPGGATVAALRNTTRAIVLDVIVTDKSGKPVSDLSWKDFSVLEGDSPQLVALFERPDQHRFSIPTTEGKTSERRNQSRPSAVTILVIDESNDSSLDPARSHEAVAKFLRNYGPRLPQPAALLTVAGSQLELLHDYTEDASTLQQVLERHATDFSARKATNSSPISETERLLNALNALKKIAAANMNFAGRKNVIWIGPAFPAFDFSQFKFSQNKSPVSTTGADSDFQRRLVDTVPQIASEIWDARLAIYSVDPRGLQGTAPTATDASGGTHFSETIAAQTGGKVFFNRNDADVAIAASMADGSDYYTLSYYPQNDWDKKFRNLRVTVARPGLETRTREGYYATLDTTHDEATLISEFTAAVSNPLPYRGLGVSVTYKLQSGTPRMARYTISVDRHDLSWQSTPDGNRRCEITAVVASISRKDPVVKSDIRGLEGTIKSDRFEKQMDEPMLFTFTAEFPSDDGRLRVVVRDNKAGRIGTADLNAGESSKAKFR